MSETSVGNDSDIERILGSESPPRRRRQVLLGLLLTLGLGAIGALTVLGGKDPAGAVGFETASASRGDLTVKVTATGTLEPVNQVEVGTEISGTIASVEADFNQRVSAGQVLARLNTDRLEAVVVQARASLESAEARLSEVQATVTETRVRTERCAKLAKQAMCSREELDTTQAAYARAQAAEDSARAQIAVARATLAAQETDLRKAVIRAPIGGIVLKRQIEPGQTVAASLQTPVLFVLAENLAQMELHVAVDEADVGQVAEGQEATFTVDAYPNRSFPARITQVRFAPETVQGVVTYGTVLAVENTDLALRPGMTATAEIIAQRLTDALLVPNAALRFKPPAPETATPGEKPSLFSRLFPGPPAPTKTRQSAAGGDTQRVWTLKNGEPVAIPVRTGATDGLVTQVLSGEVRPGMALLVDLASPRR